MHEEAVGMGNIPTNVTRRGAGRTISPGQVLAFRQRSQRLEQRTSEALADVVAAAGYVPVPGGVTPYLALRARSPRFERRLVERAVFEDHSLVEVPFTRNASVLAPTKDAAWLLRVAERGHEARLKPLRAAGLLDHRKLARLADAVVEILSEGPLTADELRARLPDPLSVPMGDVGRKAGFPSLFSVALRSLLVDGTLVRLAREGRLDREASVYALAPVPLGADIDRSDALAALAGRYFRAWGPAPVAAFAWWAEASMGEARAAVTQVGLAPVRVEGEKEPWWVGAEDLEALLTFSPPCPARLAFVPFRDPSVCGAKDLLSLLAPEHRTLRLSDWRGRLVPAGGGSLVHQHFILHGGRVAGIWSYSEHERRVVWETFSPLPTRARRVADDIAGELAEFISEQLGDARFYDGGKDDAFPSFDRVVAAWS